MLASGAIVNANQSENSDLWLALKGGSSNFGIVTRFDIATFPQDVFYGGVVAAAYSTLESQLAGFANLLANFDPYAALIMSISWSAAQGFFLFNNVEYTKDVENPPILQPFTEASPAVLNTMRISNLTDFANEAAQYGASGLR